MCEVSTPPLPWQKRQAFDQRIDEVVEANPDSTAIIEGNRSITYRELAKKIERLSTHLLDVLNGQLGFRVGICMSRSIELVVSILACQKASADYVPLDPSYPRDRLDFMIKDASPDLILVQSEDAGFLPEDLHGSPVLSIDCLSKSGSYNLSKSGSYNHQSRAPAGYVLYTSGSTGKPKGVELGGEALLNLVQWQQDLTDLPANAVTGHFAPISFDVSFQEIFSTVCSGGTLVVLSNEHRQDPFELLKEIDRCGIQRLFLPFVALQQLAQSSLKIQQFPTSLLEIHTAGEQLVATEAIRKFFEQIPGCRLFNQYGPSETHVVSCFQLPDDPRDWERLPSIGTAITNAALYLLDDQLVPLPDGELGELCVAGLPLAKGYMGRSDLTSEKFVETEIGGKLLRVYRTGDLASRDATGNIYFKGRNDRQIKVNGYRVEPGEVEGILSDHPKVDNVAIVHDPDFGEGGALVAYIKTTESAETGEIEKDLIGFLKSRLPDYMLPAKFTVVATFPLTPSGKVDRKALQFQSDESEKLQPLKLTGDLMTDITSLWRVVLKCSDLKSFHNVFDKGAKSIMVPEFQRQMLSIFGVKVTAVKIFSNPTPKSLAHAIKEKVSEQSALNLNQVNVSASLMRQSVGMQRPG